MVRGCFIGIDQGSSSTKSIVITTEGQILFKTMKALPPPFRDGLRVEHEPSDILASTQDVLNEAVRAVHASDLSILGIGLSCQRSSCLVWDEQTGVPLSPVISWRDTRGIYFVESLSGKSEEVHAATGLPLTPYYSASKFRWLKENVPAAKQPSAVFGTLSSFLVQRLTGGKRATIDHTNAARTQLMNIRSLAWDDDLIGLFGLSGVNLPEMRPTASAFGSVGTSVGTVPLLACVGDQQAAMIGQGVVERGDGGINYGTGGFLMVNTGDAPVSADGLMASVHYSTEKTRRYLLEGSVNAVGDALEWLRLRLGLFREYPEVDDMCWKASSDTVVFMGLNGTGAPYWESGISTAIHGLTVESSQADIVRGTVEGIAFFMKDITEAIRATGIEPEYFAVSGGLRNLSYLIQFQADLLGRNLVIVPEQEVSALGAAFLAGVMHGTWTPGDIKRLAGNGEVVTSEKNQGAEHRYRRWKELHRMVRELDKI